MPTSRDTHGEWLTLCVFYLHHPRFLRGMLSKTQHRYFRPRAAQPQTLLYCNRRNDKAAPPAGKNIVNTADTRGAAALKAAAPTTAHHG